MKQPPLDNWNCNLFPRMEISSITCSTISSKGGYD